jgi:hypothetical protein
MISQGIGVVTGMQKQFSWAGVAAAGAASAVTSILGGDLAPLYGEGQNVSLENIAAHMAVNAAASVASAATLSLIDGSDFGDNMISALPDIIGASLGEAIVGLTGACFVAGTLVHTPKGLTKIENIKAGDWVFSRDEHFENHDLHRKQVVDVFRFDQKATLNVTVTNAHGREVLVRATPEHPFAVEGGKWISARELRPGDHLIDIEGRRCTVARVSPADGLTTVHNIAVEHDHTYFVSENGIWVHNRYGRIDWEARAKAQREGRYAPELQLEDYEYDEWATYAVFETDRGQTQVEYYYPDAGKDLEAFIRAFDPSYDFSSPATIGPIRHVVDYGPNSIGNQKYTDLYVSQLADHAANLYDIASRTSCLKAPPLYERTYLRGQEFNLVTSGGQRASAILVPQSATSLGTISNARVLVQPSSIANGIGGSTASRIGTSGFATWQEFAEALHGVYQRATDRAYSAWMAMTPEQQRATSNRHPNAQMGSYIDEAARSEARIFVRGQGLMEGPGQEVRIGRRMYNSTGTRYVMPDIFVPGANYIADGSVSNKTLSMNNNQIANMLRYSGAPQMALVRPTQLGGGYNIPLIGPQFTGRVPPRVPPPAIMPNNARRAPTRVR